MTHWRLILEIVGAIVFTFGGLLIGRKNPKVADTAAEFSAAVKAAAEKAKQ